MIIIVNKKRRRFVFILALLIGSFATASSSWSDKTSPTIGVRNAHAMSYDSVGGKIILFGGADESSVCGDTWEWDNRKWVLVSQTGPGPRTFPAMTYDNLRKRVVLFGGNRVLFGKSAEENKFLSDTSSRSGNHFRQSTRASGAIRRTQSEWASRKPAWRHLGVGREEMDRDEGGWSIGPE